MNVNETPHWSFVEKTEEDKKRDEIADLQLAVLRIDVSTWEERSAWAKEHIELLRDMNLSTKRSEASSERIAVALESIADHLKHIAIKVTA